MRISSSSQLAAAAAAESQDAMPLHEAHLKNHNKQQMSSLAGTSLSQSSNTSDRQHTTPTGSAMLSTEQASSGQQLAATPAADGVLLLAKRQLTHKNNVNKWSQNQQQQLSISHPQAAGRQHRSFQNHQHHHQRQESVSSISRLILSILIGLSLAAIHTSALTGSASSSAPTASNGPQQQQQQQVASGALSHMRAEAPASGATATTSGGGGETGGRSLLQPPPVTLKPLVSAALDQSPSMNLIPIDQPVLSSSSGSSGSAAVAPPSGSQANNNNNNFRPVLAKDSYDGSSLNLRSTAGQVVDSSSASDDTMSSQYAQQQQQQTSESDDFAEPLAQFYANAANEAEAAYQTIIEPQQQQEKLEQPAKASTGPVVTPRQSVERRFGLFKKGHHGQQQQPYGGPAMSANYATGAFMSDCERCLASFGQQQQQQQTTAALEQQLDLPPPQTMPLAPPVVMPPLPQSFSSSGHYPMQPFAPLKSKFFMKFPFLVKPSPFGSGGLGDSGLGGGGGMSHYWPSMTGYGGQSSGGLRPSGSGMSQALFIRPAPAYNCIQASPPPPQLLASASSYASSQAEVGAGSGGGGSKTSPVASAKLQQQHYGQPQQHHHQLHAHHSQQQQQVQGYARK